MPTNGTLVGNWHVHGARSSFGNNVIDFGDWRFPLGTLYCWYLGNEANIHIHKRFGMVPRVKALHDAVRAYDPTRFAEYGSDADADGVLPVCNIHYPYYDVLREVTAYMPEMCYFHRFDQPLVPGLKIPCGQSRTLSCIGPGKNIIPYGEKPMIVHETAWNRQMEPPHPASRFAGEDAYNSAAGTVRLHHEWMAEYLKGHRDADPYAVTPWLNFAGDDLSRYYPLLDVFTLERWTHFYEGTPVVFQTDVCHDLLAAEDVAFSWRLADAGGRRVAGGGETFEANGGELFRTKIAFAAPGPGVYTLEYGVRAGGRRAVHRRKIVVAALETGEKACAALVRARNVVRPSDPEKADRLVAEAMRQKKLRTWLKAIALLKGANASDPLRVSIHHEIGDCYALMGDDLNALKWYELSKAIDDNQPVVWDLIKATRARLDSARDGSASAAGNRGEK